MSSLTSSIGFFGSLISSRSNKTIIGSFKPFSSFSSISSRKNIHHQKRCSLMVKARSPNIYSNKDMSTVKKMQVGVNKLVDIVGGILGPKRHDLMLMSKNGSLNTVNDGFSIAKEVNRMFKVDDPSYLQRSIGKTNKIFCRRFPFNAHLSL